jgi:hypothetical protein
VLPLRAKRACPGNDAAGSRYGRAAVVSATLNGATAVGRRMKVKGLVTLFSGVRLVGVGVRRAGACLL